MADSKDVQVYSDFEKLDLSNVIQGPLVAAVNAQKAAADATRAFILSLLDKDGKPVSVDFTAALTTKEGTREASIKAPLLSIVPVPHLRIDSLHISFTYEVSQITKTDTSSDKSGSATIGAGGLLSQWVTASLTGSISSKSSSSNQMNRRGTLDISLQASESEMPKGLEKMLNILSDAVTCEVKP